KPRRWPSPVVGGLRGVVGSPGVFSERELDAEWCTEEHLLGRLAPFEFDDGICSTDDIRASMQHIHDGRSTGGGAIDSYVVIANHITDADVWRHGRCAFVDAAFNREMGMRIDDSGHHKASGCVDDLGICGCGNARADCGNLPVTHKHGSVLDCA